MSNSTLKRESAGPMADSAVTGAAMTPSVPASMPELAPGQTKQELQSEAFAAIVTREKDAETGARQQILETLGPLSRMD